MNLEANLQNFYDGHLGSGGRRPNERYASFDYCFNYFQFFRESGTTAELVHSSNLLLSCLHLGFYLASWGMYRGSAQLLQKSARHLIPAIQVIAQADPAWWEIDVDSYDEHNIESICVLTQSFLDQYPNMSYTLVTKIMLGVFGSVPAFDTFFKKGCQAARISPQFGERALTQIGLFYRKNYEVIERYRFQTLDFLSGEPTSRRYTRAKVVDMALFMEGWSSSQGQQQMDDNDG